MLLSCQNYLYGVAQHHNECNIRSISIMAHTLLPNYNTTNIQLHCHISQSVEETELVVTFSKSLFKKNKFDQDL